MDVPAVQAISADLQRSAAELNNSALKLSIAVQGFTAADAGGDYSAQGERVVGGLEGLRKRIFMWVNCVNDAGTALGQAAATNGQVDQASSAALTQNSLSI